MTCVGFEPMIQRLLGRHLIHLATAPHLLLTSTEYANYCSRVLHSIRIKRCTTKCFSVQIFQICWSFCTYTEPIQSSIMKIGLFSIILDIMQYTILLYTYQSNFIYQIAKIQRQIKKIHITLEQFSESISCLQPQVQPEPWLGCATNMYSMT